MPRTHILPPPGAERPERKLEKTILNQQLHSRMFSFHELDQSLTHPFISDLKLEARINTKLFLVKMKMSPITSLSSRISQLNDCDVNKAEQHLWCCCKLSC